MKNITLLKNNDIIDCITKSVKWSNIKQNKNDNIYEKKWGNSIISQINNNQWTTYLGENIIKEVLILLKGKVWRPVSKDGFKPDWETHDGIYEVKTRNWTTSGTAGEKILGTPYKYSIIPKLYNKPLYIVSVAYQEYEANVKFKLFNNGDKYQKEMIKFWNDMNIFYIKCSDLIKEAKLI